MSLNSESSTCKAARRNAKSPYRRPRLFVYGDIREITQSDPAGMGQVDNTFSSSFKTSGSSFTGPPRP
ncbi:MAG: hypothetical protein GY953_03630 [bacterium]|nr:hypothetical protein [bacterium]